MDEVQSDGEPWSVLALESSQLTLAGATFLCADVLAGLDGRVPALRVTGKGGTRQRLIPVCEAAYEALQPCSGGRAGPLFVCAYAGARNRRMKVRAIEKRFRVAAAHAGLLSHKAHPHAAWLR